MSWNRLASSIIGVIMAFEGLNIATQQAHGSARSLARALPKEPTCKRAKIKAARKQRKTGRQA